MQGKRHWLILSALMLIANTPVAAGVFLLIYAWGLHKSDLAAKDAAHDPHR